MRGRRGRGAMGLAGGGGGGGREGLAMRGRGVRWAMALAGLAVVVAGAAYVSWRHREPTYRCRTASWWAARCAVSPRCLGWPAPAFPRSSWRQVRDAVRDAL